MYLISLPLSSSNHDGDGVHRSAGPLDWPEATWGGLSPMGDLVPSENALNTSISPAQSGGQTPTRLITYL